MNLKGKTPWNQICTGANSADHALAGQKMSTWKSSQESNASFQVHINKQLLHTLSQCR